MISYRGNIEELQIFDRFEIDQNLPKYKTDASKNDDIGKVDPVSVNRWEMTSPDSGVFVNSENNYERFSIRNWLINRLSRKTTNTVNHKKQITVIQFFTTLYKSFNELTPISEIATHYENVITQASILGQTALVQRLLDVVEVARGEAHLIVMGLKKYVTEEQIIDFYKKVGEDKNLKLSWIKNFNRIIPSDVYEAKRKVDERKIFDNYVILHYDPMNNGEKMTKEEIEKKKDPILFGVIRNSRKLYYIADWKDEYCDLTLEEMFNTLGEKVLTMNNESVKTFINKTVA